jgi:hypothetical protein
VQRGTPFKVKAKEVDSPSALVAVAVRVGRDSTRAQGDAVQTTSLEWLLLTGVERVPSWVSQEKERALPFGSSAFTRTVTVPPPRVEVADWKVSERTGTS